MNIESVKYTFVKAKDKIKLIIISVIVTAVIVYIIIPSGTKYQTNTIVRAVRDEKAIQDVMDDYEDLIKGKNSIIERLLRLNKPVNPQSGNVANPSESPLEETPLCKLPELDSTQREADAVTYEYDLPIAGFVEKNKIIFLTVNPYLKLVGMPYTKTYEYEREYSDFEFGAVQTMNSETLEGISFRFNRRFLSFDGLWIGGGANYPKEYYAVARIDLTFYERLTLSPRITSLPSVGGEITLKIY